MCSNMSSIGEILRTEFSQIDDDIYQYIEGNLVVNDIVHLRVLILQFTSERHHN